MFCLARPTRTAAKGCWMVLNPGVHCMVQKKGLALHRLAHCEWCKVTGPRLPEVPDACGHPLSPTARVLPLVLSADDGWSECAPGTAVIEPDGSLLSLPVVSCACGCPRQHVAWHGQDQGPSQGSLAGAAVPEHLPRLAGWSLSARLSLLSGNSSPQLATQGAMPCLHAAT